MASAGDLRTFKWLLLLCLLSDIADGLIARTLHLTSELGARLDSSADQLTTAAAVAGLFAFESRFIREHWLALAALAALYLEIDAGALWRYGKLTSFHTYAARAAAYAQGIFVMTLFFCGYRAWLMHLMVAISLAAYCEEIAIILRMRQWRADVRGLYWLIREARAS